MSTEVGHFPGPGEVFLGQVDGQVGGQAAAGPATTPPWLASYPQDVRWDHPLRSAPLYDLLDQSVKSHPQRTCTKFLGRATSYADIGRAVDRLAACLAAEGVSKGTRVGLMMPNCPAYVVGYFAILKAGGTVVNFNPLYALEELTHQVADSGTTLMLTLDLKLLFSKVEPLIQAGVLPRAVVFSFVSQLPTPKAILFRVFRRQDIADTRNSPVARAVRFADELTPKPGFQPPPIDADNDLAVLQYTGGTTGVPKGAMLTHANCHINVQQVALWSADLGTGNERVLGVLPFFHVFAMTVVMNLAVAKAAEILMLPRFQLDDCLSLIHRERPTVMPGVPTLFGAIINHARLADYDLSSLKMCLSGGAPLPLEIKTRFEQLTGCTIIEGYGLSETSPVATCTPINGVYKVGSIGLPLPGTHVSLRNLADPSIEVPRGEKGEICISGPQVMKGYWQKPEETDRAFTGTYFRTGDVARMDEDGYLFIEDRIKDLIICSGFNVYPRRIEEVLYSHPAVEEVTVIGIPDPYRGEAPKAFVKLRSGMQATSEQLIAHVAPRLSPHEMPSAIEFRDALPKTMVGKLSKKELKAAEAAKTGVGSGTKSTAAIKA